MQMLDVKQVAKKLSVKDRKARNIMRGVLRPFCINTSGNPMHETLSIDEKDLERWVESQKPINRMPEAKTAQKHLVPRRRTE